MIGPAMNTNRFTPRSRTAGFTLIELMIAIAIVGLLVAIAVPGYREHVRRGAVEEAHAQLQSGAVALEQYFLDNRTYVGAPCPASTTRFALTCTLAAATYTITATGSGNVSGFIYTINEQDVRATSGGWGTNAGCWIIKKGGSCGS
jgi:type IV pilus assembly protein PilE